MNTDLPTQLSWMCPLLWAVMSMKCSLEMSWVGPITI
jgi:hypothetical protein